MSYQWFWSVKPYFYFWQRKVLLQTVLLLCEVPWRVRSGLHCLYMNAGPPSSITGTARWLVEDVPALSQSPRHQKPFVPLRNGAVHAVVYFRHFTSLKLCCQGVFLSVPWRWVSSAFWKPPTQWQRSKLKHYVLFQKVTRNFSLCRETTSPLRHLPFFLPVVFIKVIFSFQLYQGWWSNVSGIRAGGGLESTLVRRWSLFLLRRGAGKAWVQGSLPAVVQADVGWQCLQWQMLSAYLIYKMRMWLSYFLGKVQPELFIKHLNTKGVENCCHLPLLCLLMGGFWLHELAGLVGFPKAPHWLFQGSF